MRHIKKALSYSIAGSLGLTVVANLHGCSDQAAPPPGMTGFDAAPNGADADYFLVIEQTGTSPDTYRVAEKHPTSGPTRAILRLPDGSGCPDAGANCSPLCAFWQQVCDLCPPLFWGRPGMLAVSCVSGTDVLHFCHLAGRQSQLV